MAQIKIYGLRTTLDQHRGALADAIHGAVMNALQYPVEKRFQRYIALDPADFLYPQDRSQHYLIIEISLFEGRSTAAKKDLIRQLFQRIGEHTGIHPQDIEITLFETPRENWGIRGVPGDELGLSYTVEV
ncbi:tautomerase family protein [Pseudomonas sp. MAFF212428]|uniref:Tautomerase family protein n=1 Tax=Pseudomonas brassicae TaxID=2708063 RepID=A0A6B3NVC9_9PSED|nr:tautomerase family protein [Pseudomonas brassicae]NER60481.1 tautomerase family protein [Pseudomonas brassicae]NER63334.1 tautomerase family protein [Pseudomonas brassicae]